MTGRTWIGEALAVYDQALTAVEDGFPPADFWVARAQAAAAIAAAEQAQIANLIAWKALQLQTQHGIDVLQTDGDEISSAIRDGLGLS